MSASTSVLAFNALAFFNRPNNGHFLPETHLLSFTTTTIVI
jgi:hypothetical protein